MKKTIGFAPIGAPGNGSGPFAKLFPNVIDLSRDKNAVNKVDAVLLWGGSDLCPALYAEAPLRSRHSGPAEPSNRDLFELELCVKAKALNKPIIGVCRGAQLICAFAGGKLIQHVNGHNYGDHSVTTFDGKHFHVTSAHHQMMYPWDVNHEMLAWSTNILSHVHIGNEGGEDYSHPLEKIPVEPEVVYFPDVNGFAVQSHPEWEEDNNPFMDWMFNLIEEKIGVFA